MNQSDKFTIRISQELLDCLKKEASNEGLSLSAYIRRLLNTHLNKTKQRALVTNDLHDHNLECNGEKTSQEGKKKESAHGSIVDLTTKMNLTSIVSPNPLKGGAPTCETSKLKSS